MEMTEKIAKKKKVLLAAGLLAPFSYNIAIADVAAEDTFYREDTRFGVFVYKVTDKMNRNARSAALLQVAANMLIANMDRFCGKKDKPPKLIVIGTRLKLPEHFLKNKSAKEYEKRNMWPLLYGPGLPLISLRVQKNKGIFGTYTAIPDRTFARVVDSSRVFNSNSGTDFPKEYMFGACSDYINDDDKKNRRVYLISDKKMNANDALQWQILQTSLLNIVDNVSQTFFYGNVKQKNRTGFIRIQAKRMQTKGDVAYRVRAVFTLGIPISGISKYYKKDPKQTLEQMAVFAADIKKDGSYDLCPINNLSDLIGIDFFKESSKICRERKGYYPQVMSNESKK